MTHSILTRHKHDKVINGITHYLFIYLFIYLFTYCNIFRLDRPITMLIHVSPKLDHMGKMINFAESSLN